ncbi:GntR family transcriptional regulator [Desulfovibrio sp. OttesenSCG-928-O18]|nr:GntR family transcriptional regulator [Desulfovibrio sp. OttesenSCG-928-O18]
MAGEREPCGPVEASADKACREIRRLIYDYVYKPGDRLYEPTLAAAMSMSRTPIREALARLVSCGFLERDGNRRGYRVPSLTPEDMHTAFRLRVALELHAAGIAAKRVTAENIAELRSMNEEEVRCYIEGDRTRYAELNERLHLRVASLSGDPYACRYVQEMLSRTTLYSYFFSEFFTQGRMPKNVNDRGLPGYAEHKTVIDALETRDPKRVRESLKRHLMTTFSHYAGRELEVF